MRVPKARGFGQGPGGKYIKAVMRKLVSLSRLRHLFENPRHRDSRSSILTCVSRIRFYGACG